ncbi:biopolymer transporter ExbD [Singulisphaera sp. Ch08]|uniref:Biopolymer transporter ExbD n=1 Tax=Singulisphaera sp. Ch08 TaxID=3120278 RepID=A0AAU7CGP1_9BACT
MIRYRPVVWVCLVLLGLPAFTAWGDEFDRIEGKTLAELLASNDANAQTSLTIGEIDALPIVLRDSRSAFLIARTGQGNLVRLLVSPALRKPATGSGPPVSVLTLERFDTFESGNLATRLARGKEILLFIGFDYDLDSGQVVPEGQGGDLRFEAAGPGKEGPRLVAIGDAKLYSLSKPVALGQGAGDPSRPSLGRTVLPTDFAGRFRLFANGQWSGLLVLKVDPAGVVSGQFRSDLNGTSYSVSGQVAADVPHKISFTVTYPRTRQEFEGLLWTEGKGAMAGTMTMLDRAFGFFAVREGGAFAPEGEDVGPLANGEGKPGRRTVTVHKGQYTLDGKAKTDMELTDSLKRAVTADPATWILLQAPADEPFSALQTAFEVIGAAGISAVRLAAADPQP